MTNSMTDRELYLLTECMEWKICDHIRCKARREIAELRSALNEARQRLVALDGDPVLDALNGDSRLADEPSCQCRSPGEMFDRDCPVHGQPGFPGGPPLKSSARRRNGVPEDHEWGPDGKCKWCPAERTNGGPAVEGTKDL